METTNDGADDRPTSAARAINAEAVQRLRITFGQAGALRYVGHLDMVRTWERGLRRAGVPLAYSGGFHPGPRFYFASGLPLGATGRAEIVDVLLTEAITPEAFLAAVGPHLPPDLSLAHAEEAPLKTPALQAVLQASVWQVDVESDEPPAALAGRIDALLAAEAVSASKRRKGRQVDYDLRPLVLAISYQGQPEPGWHRLSMTLRSEPSATGRADAVLAALGLSEAVARIERVQLIFTSEHSCDERPATG